MCCGREVEELMQRIGRAFWVSAFAAAIVIHRTTREAQNILYEARKVYDVMFPRG